MSGRGVSDWIAVRQDQQGLASRAYGVKRGADITNLSAAAMDAWVARAASAHELWAKEMDQRGHDGAALVAFLKQTARKYQAMAK